jgi:hypothetical protein
MCIKINRRIQSVTSGAVTEVKSERETKIRMCEGNG